MSHLHKKGETMTENTSEEYYLFSVDHSQSGGDLCCWWKEDSRGYTFSLDHAGRYSAKDILGQNLDYGIRNGQIHAIPCSVADEHASRMVHRDKWFRLLEKKVVFESKEKEE